MAKPTRNSTLYRLIEAGQLAHKALMMPLLDRGLEPGDDAILFVLGEKGATEAQLGALTGLDPESLSRRLARLVERDLLAHRAVGPQLEPGIALTDRGERIRLVLAENWENLEEALFGELKKKKRKQLAETLKRFTELLRL